MNPEYKDFADNLNAAIEFNNQLNKKIIFVSFTNPKDIADLQIQLKKNNIPYTLGTDENGRTYLKSIAGIELLLTYIEKKSKDELVRDIRDRFNKTPVPGVIVDLKFIQGKEPLAANIMEVVQWDKTKHKTLGSFLSGAPIVVQQSAPAL